MPAATLLLREPAVTSLTSIVEKSHHQKPPLPEYDLRLNSCQLDFVLISESDCPKSPTADEGFESDVDTLSIVSSDDSFTSGNLRDSGSKLQETDSANGSASSDSDTEAPPPESHPTKVVDPSASNESYHLVDLFVVKGDALVFRFGNLDNLKNFYTNFSTFKAIANQKAYSKHFGTKFNLLQRTDKNGITHIEITKEPEGRPPLPKKPESSSIISLNTPEPETGKFYGSPDAPKPPVNDVTSPSFNIHKESRSSLKDANSRQRSESPALYDARSRKECNAKNSHSSKVTSSQRSASTENILDLQSLSISNSRPGEDKKVWNSAEDLLASSPKRPERRKKPKAKAPPPPGSKDVFQGQYVRVNVTSADIRPPEANPTRSFSKENLSRLQNFTQKMLPTKDFSLTLNSKPKGSTFQQFRYVEAKLNERPSNGEHSWTYSVPRFLRKPRSHSETRNFTPMAYRYIDTTQNLCYGNKPDLYQSANCGNVSNRLFGMSSKLKDFSSVNDGTLSKRYDNWENRNDVRRGSLGELTYKINSTGGSLKSVIKKDDNKRRSNEKKVTFSAYTTVQVV